MLGRGRTTIVLLAQFFPSAGLMAKYKSVSSFIEVPKANAALLILFVKATNQTLETPAK